MFLVNSTYRILKKSQSTTYGSSSSQFFANRQPARQMQNEHSFTFSVPSKAIDNSHLQQSTANKFNDTQQIINEAKIDSSPRDDVRSEQEKGVVHGLAGEMYKKGEEIVSDTSTLYDNLKAEHQKNKSKRSDDD